ncbi:MAG: nuclear transport factor 2 family protein [Roseococcus sp.]
MPEAPPTLPEIAAIEAVVRLYLDGLHEGDAEKLARAFHPCAHLYSLRAGAVADLPREEWLAAVRARPSAQSQGLLREDRILAIDLAGEEAACVKVACCIPPRWFTDYLLLLRTGEGWRIVSKSFRTELRAG